MLTVNRPVSVPSPVESSPRQGPDSTRGRACIARPRVAILSTWHPEPVDNGRKQRTRQMIAALAVDYDIVLLSLLPSREIAAGIPPQVPDVWQQCVLPLPEFDPWSLPALLAGLHPLPRSVVATWSPSLAAQIAHILRETRVGLAIGTDLRTLRYLLALDLDTRVILDEPDVSPFTAGAIDTSRGLRSLRALSRHRKYRGLLHRTTHYLDAAIVASPEEAAAYRELSGASRLVEISNGATTVPDPAWRVPSGAQLLYAGSLTYKPNAEAAVYFARSVLPLIEPKVPEVALAITGTHLTTVPPEVKHPRVTLTGRLDATALEAAHRASRACVVPLLSGTGTRIKVLEAMALGVPVVSTRKGVEGLSIVPDEEFLLADTPADFAAATVRLLTDAPFAEAIGTRGRERIRREYTWESRGQQLRDLVRECLEQAPQRRS